MASILLVDDNVDFRNILVLALARGNHSVTQAESGAQALKLINEMPFDLVISDVVMPEQDGIEVLTKLRQLKPSIPIIVMSGDSPTYAALYLKIAQHLGATRVLKKPFKVGLLLETIASLGL